MRVAIWAQAAYRQQARNLGFVAESERDRVVAGWAAGGHRPHAWCLDYKGSRRFMTRLNKHVLSGGPIRHRFTLSSVSTQLKTIGR